MPNSNLGIVLINYNSLKDTKECLESIAASEIKPIIVVIDNNSKIPPNETVLKTIYPNIHLVLNKDNIGFAGGNNIGFKYLIEKTQCKYVLFLNNDTIVERDTFSILLQTIEDKQADAVSCKIVDPENRIWYAGGEINYYKGWPELKDIKKNDALITKGQSREVTFISGCLFMIKSKVYEEIGGFDNNFFMYVEDLDLSYRLVKKGLKMYYTDQTRIIHKINGSFPEGDRDSPKGIHPNNPNLGFHFYHKMSNRYLMMKKNASLPKFVLFLFYYFTLLAARNVQFFINGRGDMIKVTGKIFYRIFNA